MNRVYTEAERLKFVDSYCSQQKVVGEIVYAMLTGEAEPDLIVFSAGMEAAGLLRDMDMDKEDNWFEGADFDEREALIFNTHAYLEASGALMEAVVASCTVEHFRPEAPEAPLVALTLAGWKAAMPRHEKLEELFSKVVADWTCLAGEGSMSLAELYAPLEFAARALEADNSHPLNKLVVAAGLATCVVRQGGAN